MSVIGERLFNGVKGLHIAYYNRFYSAQVFWSSDIAPNHTPLLLTVFPSCMLGFKMTARPLTWVISKPAAFLCYGPTAKALGLVNTTAREMGASATSGDSGCLVGLIPTICKFYPVIPS
jgi:hypothetical protein